MESAKCQKKAGQQGGGKGDVTVTKLKREAFSSKSIFRNKNTEYMCADTRGKPLGGVEKRNVYIATYNDQKNAKKKRPQAT